MREFEVIIQEGAETKTRIIYALNPSSAIMKSVLRILDDRLAEVTDDSSDIPDSLHREYDNVAAFTLLPPDIDSVYQFVDGSIIVSTKYTTED